MNYSVSDVVQVTLEPDSPVQPLTVAWNGRKWQLDPGVPKLLPVPCANLWFGDPRSGIKTQAFKDDQGRADGFIPARATEVRRLRVKYGCLYGDEANFKNTLRRDSNGEIIGGQIPKVTVATLDGDIMPMVVSDPEGKNVNEAKQTINDQAELISVIQRQQKQIELLMRQVGVPDDAITGNTPESELPTDDDTPQRASKPRAKAGVVNVEE